MENKKNIEIEKKLKNNYKRKIKILKKTKEQTKKLNFIKEDLDKSNIYNSFTIIDNMIKNNKNTFDTLEDFFPTLNYLDYKDIRDTTKNIADCLDFYENVLNKQKNKWTQNINCSNLSNTYLELDDNLILPAYLIVDLFDYNEKILSEINSLLSNKKEKAKVFDVVFFKI